MSALGRLSGGYESKANKYRLCSDAIKAAWENQSHMAYESAMQNKTCVVFISLKGLPSGLKVVRDDTVTNTYTINDLEEHVHCWDKVPECIKGNRACSLAGIALSLCPDSIDTHWLVPVCLDVCDYVKYNEAGLTFDIEWGDSDTVKCFDSIIESCTQYVNRINVYGPDGETLYSKGIDNMRKPYYEIMAETTFASMPEGYCVAFFEFNYSDITDQFGYIARCIKAESWASPADVVMDHYNVEIQNKQVYTLSCKGLFPMWYAMHSIDFRGDVSVPQFDWAAGMMRDVKRENHDEQACVMIMLDKYNSTIEDIVKDIASRNSNIVKACVIH